MTLRRLFDQRRSQGLLALLAVLIVVLSTPASAASATRRVCTSGCPYSTIADALNAAEDGDTIAVGPGTYAGGFVITTRVLLRGEGASRTTITGGSPIISVASGVAAVIQGVTVSGSPDIGIESLGTLELKSSRVTNNQGIGIANSGITNTGKRLAVVNSLVTGNEIGVYNGPDGVVSVRNSKISGNGTGVYNDTINLTGGTITILNSAIDANERNGIYDDLRGNLEVTNSTVSHNGDRGIVGTASTMDITRSTISDNAGGGVASGSAGVFFIASLITIQRSVISGNHNGGLGGGIYSEFDVTVKESTIKGNDALFGGGLFIEGSLTLLGSRVTNNVAQRDGGGIWISVSSPLTVTNSRIRENSPNDCVRGTQFADPTVPC